PDRWGCAATTCSKRSRICGSSACVTGIWRSWKRRFASAAPATRRPSPRSARRPEHNDPGQRPHSARHMQGEQIRPAVVLLSGGLDSATVLAIATRAGYACHALSFRYGQRHRIELERAAVIARHLGAVRHVVLDIDLRQFGGSALTDDAIAVPKAPAEAPMKRGIPIPHYPRPNPALLTLALPGARRP